MVYNIAVKQYKINVLADGFCFIYLINNLSNNRIETICIQNLTHTKMKNLVFVNDMLTMHPRLPWFFSPKYYKHLIMT